LIEAHEDADAHCLYIKTRVINGPFAWLLALITAHILTNYVVISPTSGEKYL